MKERWDICWGVIFIALVVMICVLQSEYMKTQREFIKNGYTQQTLQGTYGAKWVKENL